MAETLNTEITPAAAVVTEDSSGNRSKALEIAKQYIDERAKQSLNAPVEGAKTPVVEKIQDLKTKTKEEKTKTKTKEEITTKVETKTKEEIASKEAILDKAFRELRRQRKAQKNFSQEQTKLQSEQAADQALKTSDPDAWLRKHGFDFREVAQKAVKAGAQTPEQKREAALEAKNKELEARLNNIEGRASQMSQQEAIHGLQVEAVHAFETYKESFPTLNEHFSPAEVAREVTQLQIDYYVKTNGREVPVKAALAALESEKLKEKSRFIREKSQATSGGSAARATAVTTVTKSRAKVGPVTNVDAASTVTAPEALTQAERRARALEIANRYMGRH
jgi:hypothetical protein